MPGGKVLVAQGGGPTAVINQTLVGVILEARLQAHFSSIYGALNGVNGIINQNLVDLTKESAEDLELIAKTPCSALGSTRDKPDVEYCKTILEVLKTHQIDTFLYIGGNDSSDSLQIIAQQAKASSYELRCVHLPKTIDNDLVINDHTPGFPSAAKFVASAFAGVNQDNRSLPGVYIGIVMGRHAGFLTAASTLARFYPDDGPHLIYLPERVFDSENFINDVRDIYNKYGRCVIAVSEGIHDALGNPIAAKLAAKVERDAHGNIQLSGTGALADLLSNYIKANTDIRRVRADTFGYLQRSFLGCVSEVDEREAREVGRKGIQFAITSGCDGTVTINRVSNYSVKYVLRDLEEVAGKTKVMTDDFISSSGTDTTTAFLDYLRPLMGTFVTQTHRFKAPQVKKIGG